MEMDFLPSRIRAVRDWNRWIEIKRLTILEINLNLIYELRSQAVQSQSNDHSLLIA